MAYKRIRVWSGSEWLEVGAQVPNVVDDFGVGTVTTDSNGDATTSIAYGGSVFAVAPFVFVQITGLEFAQTKVTPDTVGFTLDVKADPSTVITFSWFALQADFSA